MDNLDAREEHFDRLLRCNGRGLEGSEDRRNFALWKCKTTSECAKAFRIFLIFSSSLNVSLDLMPSACAIPILLEKVLRDENGSTDTCRDFR